MSYQLDEFEIVRRFFTESRHQCHRHEVLLGIGDDAAVLAVAGDQRLCISTDVLVAGVHFPPTAPPGLLAHRALAVNLSDLAAMAASPLCFTLGLVINDASEQWLSAFSEGLLSLARQFNCPLVGGDTSRGPLTITIHIQGLVAEQAMIRRQGAASGDRIYVSGYLGDAALALFALGLSSHLTDQEGWLHQQITPACRDYFEAAFYQPVPRIALARSCAALVSSGTDLSDGLAGDLGHLLQAASAATGATTGARIDLDSLPCSPTASRCAARSLRRQAALFGGDDYELCLTVPPANASAVETIASELGTPLTCIGEITSTPGLHWLDSAGRKVAFKHSAYRHFAVPDRQC